MRGAIGLTICMALAWPATALAEEPQAPKAPTRGGAEFRWLVPVQQPQSAGLLYGGPDARYVNPWMVLGTAAYLGALTRSGIRGGMAYGGVYFGVENALADGWRLDVDALGGFGGGLATTVSEWTVFASPVIEPRVSLTRVFSPQVQASIGLGYLYLPSADSLSGVIASVRVQL
ncbi:MAG: hypothetical protein ACK46X_06995 [Candidatus Sericytochromatia bacterium]